MEDDIPVDKSDFHFPSSHLEFSGEMDDSERVKRTGRKPISAKIKLGFLIAFSLGASPD